MKTFKVMFKKMYLSFFAGILFISISTAQETPEIYLIVDYMKVNPGMTDAYLQAETGAWKKFHQKRKEAGQILDWSLTKVLYPTGANQEYNYFTVTVFKDWKSLGTLENDMLGLAQKSLSESEMNKLMGVEKFRTLVKTDVFRLRAGTQEPEGAPDAKYAVVNFMKYPEGGAGAFAEVETQVWQPVHQKRVDNGIMAGWGLYSLEMPFGTEVQYNAVTADFYHKFEDINVPFYEEYMKMVHPNANLEEIEKKTMESKDLVRGIITELVDSLD